MTTAIALFGAFEEYEVRWNGDLENPEWIAQDVAAVLGIGNYRQVVSRYPDNYQGVTSSDGLDGKNREMLTLTEPGLYRMIFASRKPEAEKFRAWVFEKVLPSIRKTGGYAAMQHLQAQIDDLKSMVQQLLVREASPQENRPISPSTHLPIHPSTPPSSLFSESEIRRMNRREIYWSTIPGSRSYANCEFVRRITGEPAEGQASGMASLGEAIDRLPTPLLQQEDRVDG